MEMSEERKLGVWIKLFAGVFALLLFYFLSFGPVARIYLRGAPEAIVYLYAPLDWARLNTPIGPLVDLYMELWIPGFKKSQSAN
jgi:hypothetical protein